MTQHKKPTQETQCSVANSGAVYRVVEVLQKESAAILRTAERVNTSIEEGVEHLLQCRGRVIVSGMGKMGCIARKAAATFCSTGTPAIFLHPSEAVHGDLGVVAESDVFLALSNSGETREVICLLPHMVRLGIPMIGLTGNLRSTLAKRCHVVIDTGVEAEADSVSLAPTSSTIVAMAMCDALAITLMDRRGFTKEQFAIFHPAGNLGGKLLIKVADIMHVDSTIPIVSSVDATLRDAVSIISDKGLGAVFVVDRSGAIVGIVTDGDLRRLIDSSSADSLGNFWNESVSEHMSTA
ncbi:KpsF/GutQ family sugar-phosphate isomerase, partial [bacterium]|nr:KpsF/GutQ family sugar-phosphate isomerase [bacterium]